MTCAAFEFEMAAHRLARQEVRAGPMVNQEQARHDDDVYYRNWCSGCMNRCRSGRRWRCCC